MNVEIGILGAGFNTSGSVLGQVENLATQVLDSDIIFTVILQLVAKPLDPNDAVGTIELDVEPLLTAPTQMRYQYRPKMGKQIGLKGVNVNQFGRMPTAVTLMGVFGKKIKLLAGGRTGYQRFIDFRDRIVKWGHSTAIATDPELKNAIQAARNAIVPGAAAPGAYTFYVNYYSFFDQEFFSTVVDNLDVTNTTKMNGVPLYQVSLGQVGDIVKPTTQNVMISALQSAYAFYKSSIEAPIESARDAIANSPIAQTAEYAYVYGSLISSLTSEFLIGILSTIDKAGMTGLVGGAQANL